MRRAALAAALAELALAGCVSSGRPPIQSSGYQPAKLNSADAGIWQWAEDAEVEVRRSQDRIPDVELEAYIKNIACKVSGKVCENVRVYVLRRPVFNASMAANGMMQVYSGLLLRAQSEAQLAAVIGHEMGHYVEQHILEAHDQHVNTAGFALVLTMGLGTMGISAGDLIYYASAAHLQGFSREQERRADEYGIAALQRAGYDPKEAPAVWRQLIAERQALDEKPERDPVFATHPSSEERMQTLEARAARLPGGERNAAQLRAQIAPYRKAWLEDELDRGTYTAFLKLLDSAEERHGPDALTLHFRGEALRRRGAAGDNAAAIAAYRAALRRDDPPVEAHRGLGLALKRAGEAAEADAALAAYVAGAPDAPDRALIQSMIEETS